MNTHAEPKMLCSIPEAAHLLGVSPRTIDVWISAGYLQPVALSAQTDGTWRLRNRKLDRGDLLAFVDVCKVNAAGRS